MVEMIPPLCYSLPVVGGNAKATPGVAASQNDVGSSTASPTSPNGYADW